jgi:hypothetical protein
MNGVCVDVLLAKGLLEYFSASIALQQHTRCYYSGLKLSQNFTRF